MGRARTSRQAPPSRAACPRAGPRRAAPQQAIQECIDINEHVARRGWGVELANAHEGFHLWGEHGIMPPEFASEVARASSRRSGGCAGSLPLPYQGAGAPFERWAGIGVS